jgi:hypothetical protein
LTKKSPAAASGVSQPVAAADRGRRYKWVAGNGRDLLIRYVRSYKITPTNSARISNVMNWATSLSSVGLREEQILDWTDEHYRLSAGAQNRPVMGA